MVKKYWLLKSEPDVFSLDDLKNCKNKTTYWDGVRNYQARNYLRDEMKKGDGIFFYYSSSDPMGIFGICEVTKEGYPDHTQFDRKNPHYFPSASLENPVWFMVDIKLIKIFHKPVTLQLIKDNPKLKNMKLIQKGNRLSVMPVLKGEWDEIILMSK
jgi:predicted RNA-binding protein with PUA-like domain